jgi:hypothetical protein
MLLQHLQLELLHLGMVCIERLVLVIVAFVERLENVQQAERRNSASLGVLSTNSRVGTVLVEFQSLPKLVFESRTRRDDSGSGNETDMARFTNHPPL